MCVLKFVRESNYIKKIVKPAVIRIVIFSAKPVLMVSKPRTARGEFVLVKTLFPTTPLLNSFAARFGNKM